MLSVAEHRFRKVRFAEAFRGVTDRIGRQLFPQSDATAQRLLTV